ncbi:MAG: type II toxin-antitoxin system RelE/ParE family toxin [Bacteroidota bacterium]
MVKRKIIWSHRARIKLYEILEFYTKRNKNTAYSRKLYKRFTKELNLLIKQPDLGINTDLKDVRGLIVNNYILFYEITEDFIIIHTLWDSRQNPNDLIIK